MTGEKQIASDSTVQTTPSTCDIRCQTASTPRSECECSCGGHNHGQTKTLGQFEREVDEVDEDDLADRDEYTGECLLCSEDFENSEEVPWTVRRNDPLWSEIPNPPEDAKMVDVCDACYTKWLMNS